MNANAQKWVDALVSDEFDQTEGQLRKDDSYCCLGVACEVFRRETGEGEWDKIPGGDQVAFAIYERRPQASLPDPVVEWLGLSNDGGRFTKRIRTGVESATTLWQLNDNQRWTLKQIGEFIASEPEGLFPND